MATTTPFRFIDFLPPAAEQAVSAADLGRKAGDIIAEYEAALGDADKADDEEDAAFYAGKVEGLERALTVLLDVPQDAWDAYQGA